MEARMILQRMKPGHQHPEHPYSTSFCSPENLRLSGSWCRGGTGGGGVLLSLEPFHGLHEQVKGLMLRAQVQPIPFTLGGRESGNTHPERQSGREHTLLSPVEIETARLLCSGWVERSAEKVSLKGDISKLRKRNKGPKAWDTRWRSRGRPLLSCSRFQLCLFPGLGSSGVDITHRIKSLQGLCMAPYA